MAAQPGDYASVIYDRGCLRAGEEWVERNLVPVAGVTVALAVLQVKQWQKEAKLSHCCYCSSWHAYIVFTHKRFYFPYFTVTFCFIFYTQS